MFSSLSNVVTMQFPAQAGEDGDVQRCVTYLGYCIWST